MSDLLSDLLSGGAGARPGLPFPTIGTTHKGTVLSFEKEQATDMDDKPRFFASGDPIMEYVFVLQTDYRDRGDDDDGRRWLFAGWKKLDAIRDALRTAGVKTDDAVIGGTLAIQYTGDEQLKGGKTAKLYRSQFVPGTSGDLVGSIPAVDDLV